MGRGVVVLSGTAYAYEELDLTDDAAHGVTASNLYDSIDKPCEAMLVTVEAQTINFTVHGTSPTASAGTGVGHQITAGNSIIISGHENCKNFEAINDVAGSDGIVKITFYT